METLYGENHAIWQHTVANILKRNTKKDLVNSLISTCNHNTLDIRDKFNEEWNDIMRFGSKPQYSYTPPNFTKEEVETAIRNSGIKSISCDLISIEPFKVAIILKDYYKAKQKNKSHFLNPKIIPIKIKNIGKYEALLKNANDCDQLIENLTSLLNTINPQQNQLFFKSRLIFIQKGDDEIPSSTESLRPICITSTFYKIMDKIISERIMRAIKEKSWIHESQHGFMKNLGTATQLARVAAMIQSKRTHSDNGIYLIFVDVKKAFDTVPRDILYRECLKLSGD
jgi:hypothetical protein